MVTTSTATSTMSSGVLSPSIAVAPMSNNVGSSVISTVETSSGVINGNGACRTQTRVSDNRRSNKPIMEKRRRARINNCLNELKTLILDAMKKDPARHSKLEKADILEMTVKHLQNLQRQQTTMNSVADPAVINKFRAGFTECASEVGRFPGLDPIVKRKLLQHLGSCLNQANKPQEVPQVQVHILPNNIHRTTEQQVPQSGIILSNGQGGGVQLVPTRLPSGEIALVLPSSAQQHPSMPSPVPLLVPIVPERSASTNSSASTGSSYSPSQSPEPAEAMYCQAQQKPLSLVVRKVDENDNDAEERPWRPW
ncbi:protein hairy-like [Sitophilus oryzae]|uniref:Protein hairy-like n=1 Tax=Sitophilus oryzae TaxID=7048 RepID=A0A6J2XVD5_SITOR|nr:protein hairy-like [Sitophilus oryzae]